MDGFYRDKANRFAPFRKAVMGTAHYDLRLEKDGAVANIIAGKVVSIDGINDKELADSLFEQLARLGFTR